MDCSTWIAVDSWRVAVLWHPMVSRIPKVICIQSSYTIFQFDFDNLYSRWYAKKDRWEEARSTLSTIRHLDVDHTYILKELSDIREQIIIGMPPGGGKMSKTYMLKRLYQKGTRNRIAIGLLLMACQNLTGVNVRLFFIYLIS
jgi:hypothetical protein